jgi:hypothetical protein
MQTNHLSYFVLDGKQASGKEVQFYLPKLTTSFYVGVREAEPYCWFLCLTY